MTMSVDAFPFPTVDTSKSVEDFARQNCASILLKRQTALYPKTAAARDFLRPPSDQRFKCKTCHRCFGTFQALGGHRASHRKIRLDGEAAGGAGGGARVHECKKCEIRFPTGQALGGHMRKHVEISLKRKRDDVDEKVLEGKENRIEKVPVMSKSKMSKRVFVLEQDLNLEPFIELL